MKRQKYPTERILLRSQEQKDFACLRISNAPLDEDSPLEVLIREYRPTRSLDQNALMWAGIMSTIQREMSDVGMSYTQDAWHIFCKQEFLPDEQNPDEDFEEDDVRDGYQKYQYLPNGERHLCGSTTQLTKKGFSKYLEKVCSYFATNYGIEFRLRA